MIVSSHQTWLHGGCHGNPPFKSFPILCRFLPRQMLACLRAFTPVNAKTGLFFEVLA